MKRAACSATAVATAAIANTAAIAATVTPLAAALAAGDGVSAGMADAPPAAGAAMATADDSANAVSARFHPINLQKKFAPDVVHKWLAALNLVLGESEAIGDCLPISVMAGFELTHAEPPTRMAQHARRSSMRAQRQSFCSRLV